MGEFFFTLMAALGQMERKLIAEAARRLRAAGGNTKQQRAIVNAMDAALALCRWIKEPGLFADVKFY